MAITIDMSGKVVLVTGGTKGVGAAVTHRFIEAGATVEICGRNEPEGYSHDTAPARFTGLNVRNADELDAWVADVVDRHGRIDVVVNNAGGSPFGRFEEGSPRYFTALMDVNFLSAANLSRAAYPALKASRGSIINITSISARRPSPGTTMYGAAKAALESFTKSVAAEWAPDVRVNAISCGLVATESALSHYGDEEQFAKVSATIPRGQFADPQEIADVCIVTASSLTSHVTGAVINVDGGGEWPAFLEHTPNAGTFSRLPDNN